MGLESGVGVLELACGCWVCVMEMLVGIDMYVVGFGEVGCPRGDEGCG